MKHIAHILDLSNNNFAKFPAELERFSKVEYLDLSGNHLSSPLPAYMPNLKDLKTLNLSNNNYDVWVATKQSYTITILDLSKNKINKIDVGAFSEFPRLYFLNLFENRIYDLPSNTFSETKNLETLILSRNYFSAVPNFQSPSLTSLHLSNCQITNLTIDSLLGMNSLLFIDLSMNQIENIPDYFASHTLQELDLSYNGITSLTDSTFLSLPHLAVLDLRGNDFKEVWSTSHFASNEFLREIHVKGNRWSCEGFSVNLLLMYEFLTREPPKTKDISSLICYSPSNVTQMTWRQAYIRTWHPDDSSGESYTAIAVMIGIVIGIILTSFVCRGLIAANRVDTSTMSSPETTVLNLNGTTQPADPVVIRIPLQEDLPPTYDEALLMPRLDTSFHSLPDFVDEDRNDRRRYRRSRSIGDLTEYRPRTIDRRSIRRTIQIHNDTLSLCSDEQGDVMIFKGAASILILFTLIEKGETYNFEDEYSESLCNLCHCSEDNTNVDCSRRGLTEIPNGIDGKVKYLNISNNEFSKFPVNLTVLDNLITLDISGNLLSEISENALRNVTKLQILDLSSNQFESWSKLNPNYLLRETPNLKILDLSHNKFKAMDNLKNHELLISQSLEVLILNNCEINSIYGRSFISGLTNLQELQLNSNPLLRFLDLVSPSLRKLYISNTQLTSTEYTEFSYLSSLVYLQLSHNYRLKLSSTRLLSDTVKFLDISYCNLLKPNIQGFPNLKKAIISHNTIRYLVSNEFVNNTKLEHLDLSYNNIGSLRSDTFRGLVLLNNLDLSWNEIGILPENCLQELPSLSRISLSRNYLTHIGHLKSDSLTDLDVSSCEISAIGKDSLEGLQSLLYLDLSHNVISHIPDSISSNTLKHLNLNVNRISFINNFTFFMLPRLTTLSVIGNRFTIIWKRSYFQSNPYLERLEVSDNMWRCDCKDDNMYDFFEFLTLEPYGKEDSYNLICNSPLNVIGQTWLEACYFTWYPAEKAPNPDGLIWFLVVMIIGLASCIAIVNCIRNSMKRRLATVQAERERQAEEMRDRLRQQRIRAEQEELCNTPDPRDLIPPPSYDEALTMPKLSSSCHSLCETGTGKTKRRRGRRKTKSSGDLLDETERNGDLPVHNELELTELGDDNDRQRRRRRQRRCSQEINELEHSPGVRRRRMSEYGIVDNSIDIEVEAELTQPLRERTRRHSGDNTELRESDL
ncbi:uncharacterized protein LOC131843435 [Achroia grisella]|uniref:uncharacterized protein LOC131843435 n=1 Tax=Achroia grisella TaxID=688607 RepID=UPI0027D21E19|nr:uncharacterized protein LOC131843435 [Achroia grisella]